MTTHTHLKDDHPITYERWRSTWRREHYNYITTRKHSTIRSTLTIRLCWNKCWTSEPRQRIGHLKKIGYTPWDLAQTLGIGSWNMANLSQHQRRWQNRKNDRRDRTHSPQKYLKDGFARMEVSRNYETECETSHNYRNFLQYCNQEINVSANKRTQTPRCMARILVTNIPIKWWQNLPGAVKRSHEVFGMDGEDGFITSLYRRESRRPQQGSLGHII